MHTTVRPLKQMLTLALLMMGLISVCPTAQATSSADRKVAAIRKEVTAINNGLSKLSQKVIPIDGISLEGARATYFRKGTDIKKIAVEVYGETFKSTVDLYYSRGKLIFAFERFSSYEAGIGSDVATTDEYRVYYSGDTLVRALIGTKVLAPEAAKEESEKIVEISKQVKAAIA
jgi:hypothetical protein